MKLAVGTELKWGFLFVNIVLEVRMVHTCLLAFHWRKFGTFFFFCV